LPKFKFVAEIVQAGWTLAVMGIEVVVVQAPPLVQVNVATTLSE